MFTFLARLQWPTVVLLIAVIAAIVVAAALGVDRELVAIIGALGALLTAFAPALGKRDADVLVLLLAIGFGPLLVSGCGATAQRTTATTACSALLITIGEADGIEAERAEADRQTVREVCARYVGSAR